MNYKSVRGDIQNLTNVLVRNSSRVQINFFALVKGQVEIFQSLFAIYVRVL